MQEKIILNKEKIPKHLLKYFKTKEKKTVIHYGYLSHLMQIMAECKRVLKKTGTMWINLGDSYGGWQGKHHGWNDNKQTCEERNVAQHDKSDTVAKSLIGIPERFVIRMTDELGLIRRNTIIWYKRNCMPSSAKDRFTVDFEYVYFFTRQGDYWFEQQLESYKAPLDRWGGEQVKEYKGKFSDYGFNAENYNSPRARTQRPSAASMERDRDMRPDKNGRNRRCVWDIKPEGFNERKAHYKRELIDDYFSIIDREDKAYWLGFLFADGWAGDRVTDLCLGDLDLEHVELFRRCLGSTHAMNHYGNRARVVICSKRMANDLRKWGMNERNKFPNLSPNMVNHFVRGIFDGDGSIWYYASKTGNYTYPRFAMEFLGKENIIEAINHIIGLTLNKRFTRNTWSLRVSSKEDIQRCYEYLYQNSTIFLERKRMKFPQECQGSKGALWDIPTKPFKGAHFAVFPEALVEPMLKAGCPPDGWVLDPFCGSGTVGVVAKRLGIDFIGIELNPEYVEMSEKRIEQKIQQTKLDL